MTQNGCNDICDCAFLDYLTLMIDTWKFANRGSGGCESGTEPFLNRNF